MKASVTTTGLSRLALYVSLSGWVILAIYVLTSIERAGFSFQILQDFVSVEEEAVRFRALMLFGPLITSVLGYFLSERAKSEKSLMQANRALKALSECNLILVRAREEAQLLKDICKAVVELGGYRLAWVAYAEQGEAKTVRPVAHFGDTHLDTVKTTWADDGHGDGPAGTAIRTGRPAVAKDVRHAPGAGPWIARALRHGYASSIALPLSDDGKPFGALNIHAAAPYPFDAEEVKLLAELADDLAFGIKAIRTRQGHRLAEEKLKESQRSLSTLISNLPGMAYRCRNDRERTMEFASDGCYELTGYRPSEIIGNAGISYSQVVHPDHRDIVWDSVQAALPDRKPFQCVFRIIDKSGRERWAWEKGQGIFSDTGELLALEGLVMDVTERVQAEEKVKLHLEQLKTLRTIETAITASLDLRMTLDVFLEQLIGRLNVDAAAVLLLDPNTMFLRYSAGKGFKTERIKHAEVRLGESYAGRIAKERKSLIIPDLSKSEKQPTVKGYDFTDAFLTKEEGFKAYFGVPLVVKGRTKGILEVFCRSPFQPDPAWLSFLEALAGQAAIAIDNASLFDDLQRSHEDLIIAYDTTIEGWSKALDYRDRETENHSQRVTDMTMRVARQMGMQEPELVHMRRGALLHDIGKLGVPDHILFKAGGLTDEEWVIMKRHPEIAYELLSPIPYLRPAVDIPYCHHEKWDGSGYPRGLSGEQIPVAARVFAVVDVWDALRSDRPYRPGWPREKVVEYLREKAGSHFDPKVVEAFLKIEW